MGMYALPGTQTVSTAYKSVAIPVAVTGTLARGKVMDAIFGALSAPNATDTDLQIDISRCTAASTNATAYTPTPVDPADSTCRMTAQIAAVTEPTVTANSALLTIGMNQRNTARWTALDEAKALIWPATNANGLAARVLSPNYSGSFSAHLWFLEG